MKVEFIINCNHRWGLPVNSPIFTVVMVICHTLGESGEFSLPPTLCITYTIMNNYYPGKHVNIHKQSLINITQENNWLITKKKGKGKLPLFLL